MKNQIKAGAILTYISLFVGNVVTLFYTPFMLRTLGQGEYGLFSLAHAVVGYLTVLDFGFGSATIRYTAKYRAEGEIKKAESLYGMFIILYGLIGLIIFFLGIIIAAFADSLFAKGLSPTEIVIVKKLLILSTINLAVSFPFGVFTSIITAYEKFIFLKVTGLVRLLLNPLVYVPVLLLGYKSYGLIIASTVLNFIFLSINVFYCIKFLKIRIQIGHFDFLLLKEILNYSVWIFIGTVVNQLWWNAGQLLLGVFASSVAIAIYSIAMQFKTYFESFATAISGVFLPKMTAMVSSGANDQDFTDYFIKVGRLQFIVIALITTGFILFGKQFITIWAGSDYIQSFYVTLIIFIPLSIVDTQTLGITILQAKNKHKFRSLLYLGVALLCVIICIPFIKTLGAIGCAIATAVALIIGNIVIINWYYYKKIGLNIQKYWLELLSMMPGVLIASVLSYLILRFIPSLESYKTLIPAMVIYSLFYILIMFFLSFNKYEKSLVLNLYLKLKFRRKNND